MTSGKTKLVFFGNERLVSGLQDNDTPILRMLIEQGYDIVAVVAHHSDTRSRNGRPLEIARVASEYGIPLLTPSAPVDIYDELTTLHAEAGVLVAYGRIIPQKVIDIFPKGIINVHPSLLPNYRGPTPIESPILAGDNESGISIIQLSSKMDAGDIYAQHHFPIQPTDTKFDIYKVAAQLSTELLLNTLPSILNGSLLASPQDESQATYCQLLDKSHGNIDWSEPAESIERKVRAFLGWPQTRATLGSVEVIVTAGHTIDTSGPVGQVDTANGEITVYTTKGAFVIDSLKPAGKQEMSAASFLAGYKHRL